ncbi:acylphosphatase [Salinicoccus sp. CNSTN-B1]
MPEGRQFGADEKDDAIMQYAAELGYPVVLKPTDGSFGKGVVTNILSTGELERALVDVREKDGFQEVILEQYVKGQDHRFYVVDGQTVAAMHRIPPNVTGDGEHAIRQLIRQKNTLRRENPRLISCPIIIDKNTENYLARSNYDLSTVPAKGEKVYLSDKGNISIGGDPVDVFDTLPNHIKETAAAALAAIPGLNHGAVDMMISGEEGKETGHVIELNPTSQLGGLLYPVEGQARDIPARIIDYYFPETKHHDVDRTRTYFDFHDLLDPLQSRDAVKTTVAPSPVGTIYAKKYRVTGYVQNVGYHRGLRKQAFERNLHGYVMSIEDGAIEVVVGGNDQEMVDDFENGLWEDEERAQVFEVTKEEYNGPIRQDLKSNPI